jgi:hypothetical protein
MRFETILRPLLPVGAAALFSFAGAAQAEDVYVVHAIPGTAIGLPDDALEVDIAVGGGCPFPGVEFMGSGSADLAVGSYEVAVSLTDGSCGGAVAVVGSFDIALGETAVVVAHLNQAGSPTLTKLSIDGSMADTRVTILHGAGAPPVKLSGKLGKSKIKVNRLANGEETFAVDGAAGELDLSIKPADGGPTVFKAKDLPVAGNLLIIAAGTLATDTFQPVIVEIGATP